MYKLTKELENLAPLNKDSLWDMVQSLLQKRAKSVYASNFMPSELYDMAHNFSSRNIRVHVFKLSENHEVKDIGRVARYLVHKTISNVNGIKGRKSI